MAILQAAPIKTPRRGKIDALYYTQRGHLVPLIYEQDFCKILLIV